MAWIWFCSEQGFQNRINHTVKCNFRLSRNNEFPEIFASDDVMESWFPLGFITAHDYAISEQSLNVIYIILSQNSRKGILKILNSQRREQILATRNVSGNPNITALYTVKKHRMTKKQWYVCPLRIVRGEAETTKTSTTAQNEEKEVGFRNHVINNFHCGLHIKLDNVKGKS